MTPATPQQAHNASHPSPKGWMVVGVNTHSISPQALKVPVLAINEQSALLEAAAKVPGLEPVGAMSAEEIRSDVARLMAHPQSDNSTVWMVLGLNPQSPQDPPQKIPVVAVNAQAAMLEAAAKTLGLEPVGAVSVTELAADMERIRAHCQAHGITV